MQKLKNKTIAITLIAFFLISTFAIAIVENNPVKAQLAAQQQTISIPSGATPNATATTIAHISFRPRIVGIGQPILVNMWLETTILNANYQHLKAYRVTITKPDGTTDIITKDSYVADTTAWIEYTPNQVGTWSIKLDYLGQYFPAGYYYNGVNYPSIAAIGPYTPSQFGAPSYSNSVYYKPGSDGPYDLVAVSYTHLRAHETDSYLVCRL